MSNSISFEALSLTSQILMREFDFEADRAIEYARHTAHNAQKSNPTMAGEYHAIVTELQMFKENREMACSPDLPAMTPEAMVQHLTLLGLSKTERSKVMETYRDAGQAEALEQAARHLKGASARLAGAKRAASTLAGISI